MAFAAAAVAASALVKPGVETLRDNGFKVLEGKRVGLITNPTGVDNNLKSTVDILHEAPNVQLVALYGPEHGVRGDVHAGDKVDNSVDPATGVKVYSLYGKTRKPTKEMLKDIDVLVYDIQDIGCRSFTFISTMGVAMEACAEQGKEFVVLDRPNPLGGFKVEGNLVENGFTSFVSQFPIPYIYGLTPGELAMMLNEEGMLEGGKKVKLTVVPMTGWHRYMNYRQTEMPWLLPSPHIPNPDVSDYYPATGILGELYVISIGVGYTLPFQLIGAQWIDAEKFAMKMNALQLPGVIFRAIHYKPFYGTGKGENLQGVHIYITDALDAPLSLIQFYAMQVLAEMYPDHKAFELEGAEKRFGMFDKVCGSDQIRLRFTKNYRVADIIDYWNKDAEAFKAKSAKYYLYR
ncbi:MAG: exo-beta-N-acetylmuramidase NamZ domain-containing protein [Muribaculaceae bacterium]